MFSHLHVKDTHLSLYIIVCPIQKNNLHDCRQEHSELSELSDQGALRSMSEKNLKMTAADESVLKSPLLQMM